MGFLDLIKQPTQTEWADAWEKLAALTHGIEKTDPRYAPVMAALNQCDDFFLAGDWAGFQQIAENIGRLMKN